MATLAVGLEAASPATEHAADGVFVVTPHHVQRVAVKRQLASVGLPEVTVDTVERMQGKERDVVIVCMAYQDADRFVSAGLRRTRLRFVTDWRCSLWNWTGSQRNLILCSRCQD